MAIDDTNVYQRNLKMVSGAFIAYWLLGLEVTTNPHFGTASMNLMFVHFTINNPFALRLIAWSLLIYTAWRYFVNKEDRFSDKVFEYAQRRFGHARNKSKRLKTKVIRTAMSKAKELDSFKFDLNNKTSDDVEVGISWNSGIGPRQDLQVKFKNKGDTHFQTTNNNEVKIPFNFREYPLHFTHCAFLVLLKDDVTHRSVIPLAMLVAAILSGIATMFRLYPF